MHQREAPHVGAFLWLLNLEGWLDNLRWVVRVLDRGALAEQALIQ